MDTNLQRPFLLADAHHWALGGEPALAYDGSRRVLKLASARARAFTEHEATARARLDLAPGVVDRHGTRARWDAASHRVLASGGAPGEEAIYTAAPGWPVTDMALGHDGVLYMVAGGRVVLKDLRGRWETVDRLVTEGFTGWRVAAAPGGGAYVLDRIFRHVALVTGLPMRAWPVEYGPEVFRPRPEDPDPPRGTVLRAAVLPASERPVAIACSPGGRLAVMSWIDGADARLRVLRGRGGTSASTGSGEGEPRFGAPQVLEGLRFPYSLAWVAEDRVAVLVATTAGPQALREALVFRVEDDTTTTTTTAAVSRAVGDIYPLRDHSGAPFLKGLALPPSYPTRTGAAALQRLVWPSFAETAAVSNATVLDSGSSQTVWHRLYLEAAIPPGCGVRVRLAATDDATPPDAGDAGAWHEHHFGAVPPSPGAPTDVPRGAWMRERSEIPFHPGFLPCPSRKDEAGLFTVLIQRAGRRVRSLPGRYLWVRLELAGDGRSTPEVAAVRAYASRRSYTNYLPELYRESLFGPEGDEPADSTRADFLDRFLGLFESVLTPLEDRIARAELLTDPRTTPAEALEWLASWIGFGFAAGLPPERRRDMLIHAPELARRRGTLDGLKLALDLATGGAITRGEIVVVEDFRLRRTFATILGADLADESDPLLGGLAVSGNSLVGDTLFLGDEDRKEFLALFAAGVERSARERQAVAALFERLAFRATVLVHAEMNDQELGLVRAIADRESPAHIEVKVATASQRFLVGVASLLGVDTLPGRKLAPRPVRVGASDIGRRDRVEHIPSLDPRLGRTYAQAIAAVAPPPPAQTDQPFTLDARGSRPAPGRNLVRYRWTLVR